VNGPRTLISNIAIISAIKCARIFKHVDLVQFLVHDKSNAR
jgi:hypothetical protein